MWILEYLALLSPMRSSSFDSLPYDKTTREHLRCLNNAAFYEPSPSRSKLEYNRFDGQELCQCTDKVIHERQREPSPESGSPETCRVEMLGGAFGNGSLSGVFAAVVPAVARRHRPRRVRCRGHASENPELPTSLAATPDGIRFLGPPASAMAALGDKVALNPCFTQQG